MRVCVGSGKGGVAKTMSAVHLALGLARSGSVLLVDSDPAQPQAYEWSLKAEDAWPENIRAYRYAARDLAKHVRPMLEDYDHVVFDTGPKNPDMLRQAMSMADVLLIPTQPTSSDMPELEKVFEMAADVDELRTAHGGAPLPAVVLLVRLPTNDGGVDEDEARELLKQWDMPVMQSRTRDVKRYRRANGSVPDELGDYEGVLKELLEEFK